MEYLFVLSEQGGWWLKIDTVEKLVDYHQKTDGARYENAIDHFFKGEDPRDMMENAIDLQQRIKLMRDRNFKYMMAAVMKAEQINGTVLDGFRAMKMEAGFNELQTLKEFGAVYFNSVGGHTHGIEFMQFCRRSELIFPFYSKEDIRIKRYENGGKHWYAFIGDMQIRDGNKLKWNTYEEAQRISERVWNQQ